MFVLVVLRNESRGTCMAAGPGLQTPHLLHCNHCIMMYHCHRMKLLCYQWIVVGVAGFLGWTRKLFTRRLSLATGRTSDPFLPHFAGQEDFGGRIFHGKQFLENRDTLQTAKAVTVFGASKSAWDAVYAYATAGVQVNWIIRRMSYFGE